MVLVTFSGSTFFQFLSLNSSPDRFLDPVILLLPSSSYFLAIPLLRSRTPPSGAKTVQQEMCYPSLGLVSRYPASYDAPRKKRVGRSTKRVLSLLKQTNRSSFAGVRS